MFEKLSLAPPDPLLGIIERFRRDTNPHKIDLGVGVYKDENNKTPVLNAVKAAETHLLADQQSKAYLGPSGDAVFTERMCHLALSPGSAALGDQRIAALQTPGGCGALRVAAELTTLAKPTTRVWVSDPTWANHVPLLGDAGMEIATYPYYDYQRKSIRFESMMETLNKAAAGDMVLLHACCHNPCGADLNREQWQSVVALTVERGLIPFVDMAYQGFGHGLDEDAYGLRLVVERSPEAVFAISCSKNFGLYRDRVGVVGVLAKDQPGARAVMSNLAKIVRGIYSMPPDHGAAVVAHILGEPDLRRTWVAEVEAMSARIQDMRQALSEEMDARGFDGRFHFVRNEQGMFSFLGIDAGQVSNMAEKHGVYMADSSRINVAGLNHDNLEYFCEALSDVLS